MKRDLQALARDADARRRAFQDTLGELRERLSVQALAKDLVDSTGLGKLTRGLPQAVRGRPVVFAGLMAAALYLTKTISARDGEDHASGPAGSGKQTTRRKSNTMTKGGHHGHDDDNRIRNEQGEVPGAQG